MITVMAVGSAVLVVIAIVVGIVDATQAGRWRDIAADRRENRERRQQLHDVPDDYAGWGDEDD